MRATRRGSLRRGARRLPRPRRPVPAFGGLAAPAGRRASPPARSPSAHYLIAHELRTPLTSLVVGSRILLNGAVNGARRREVARDVAAEAQRLSGAVEDLLVLAGLEATAADPEPVSLQGGVRVEVGRAAHLAPQLRVRTLLASDVPPVVADGRVVQHLVRNLVAMAAEVAGDRGLVEAVLVGIPGGGIRLRVAGRPDRRDAPAGVGRPAAPLRDVATRVLAERLGATLLVVADPAAAVAELTLPTGGEGASGAETPGDRPAIDGDAPVTWV